MNGSSVLASDLYVPANFSDNRLRDFLNRGAPATLRFIESLLLFDKVVIPTDDFIPFAIFCRHFGESSMEQMLEDGALEFVRTKGGMAFAQVAEHAGNGGVICSYVHPVYLRGKKPGDSTSWPSTEEVVEIAIKSVSQWHSRPPNVRLKDLALSHTNEIDLAKVYATIEQMTIRDIDSSTDVADWTGASISNRHIMLKGKPRTVSVYSGAISDGNDSPTQRVLALAHANLCLTAAMQFSIKDITTNSFVAQAARAKGNWTSVSPLLHNNFEILREIAAIPDVGAYVFRDPTQMIKLLHLRRSRSAHEFRVWFDKGGRVATTTELARAIVEQFRQVPTAQTLPVRMVRLAITSIVGLAASMAGAVGLGEAVSLIDTVVVDWLFKGKSPRFFLDDLTKWSMPEDSVAGVVNEQVPCRKAPNEQE